MKISTVEEKSDKNDTEEVKSEEISEKKKNKRLIKFKIL